MIIIAIGKKIGVALLLLLQKMVLLLMMVGMKQRKKYFLFQAMKKVAVVIWKLFMA
jgi:hypothetical protein